MGPEPLPKEFTPDEKGFKVHPNMLHKTQPNGEVVKRDWLVFSKEKEAFYCFPCRLFFSDTAASMRTPSSLCLSSGRKKTQGWRNLYNRFPEHENSALHKSLYVKWRELEYRVKNQSGISDLLAQELQNQTNIWRQLLHRILDVIITLAERSLAFLGSNKQIGDVHNGNFLGFIELLSRYDPLLQQHVEKVRNAQKQGKRLQAHYLSPDSQNEFINLCSNEVRNKILQIIKEAKYYSIIVDATPDVSNEEQNTFVIRYLCQKNNAYCIEERFMGFVESCAKSGLDLQELILKFLLDMGIPFDNCRGQGYDNASNMSGKYKGVQSRLQDKNESAIYSPCGCHSLNLCGTDAVSSTVEFITFFGVVQELYVLFSSSPKRWKLLQECIGCNIHKLSGKQYDSMASSLPHDAGVLYCIIIFLFVSHPLTKLYTIET